MRRFHKLREQVDLPHFQAAVGGEKTPSPNPLERIPEPAEPAWGTFSTCGRWAKRGLHQNSSKCPRKLRSQARPLTGAVSKIKRLLSLLPKSAF